MANKNVYVADEDLPIFQEAQELAGESISKVIVQALRQYVMQKELEATGLKEYVAMEGDDEGGLNVNKIRFIGKLISTAVDGTENGEKSDTYTLYYTRKGKFLLQVRTEYHPKISNEINYRYEIIDDFDALCAKGLLPKLIKDAEEQLGKSHIRFIDI
jgi:hypothetical protein